LVEADLRVVLNEVVLVANKLHIALLVYFVVLHLELVVVCMVLYVQGGRVYHISIHSAYIIVTIAIGIIWVEIELFENASVVNVEHCFVGGLILSFIAVMSIYHIGFRSLTFVLDGSQIAYALYFQETAICSPL